MRIREDFGQNVWIRVYPFGILKNTNKTEQWFEGEEGLSDPEMAEF